MRSGGCRIQYNTIKHSGGFSAGAFAALMNHKWPGKTSGDYNGTDVAGNLIDCGPENWCGVGLLIGSDPWYNGDVFGGAVHHNTITNVEQGVLIDDAKNMAVHHNKVSNTTQFTWTSKGLKRAYAHSMDYGQSSNIAKNGDPTNYTQATWGAFALPNY